MEYLHTMIRVFDVDRALEFFVRGLGLRSCVESARRAPAQANRTPLEGVEGVS